MNADKIQIGSDNVFKDLGYANPEERLVKAELTRRLNASIKKNKWTQTKAAEILGIPQPKISLLNKGVVSGFSIGKLMTLLSMLNMDIDIVIHEKANTKKARQHFAGHIRVINSTKTDYFAEGLG